MKRLSLVFIAALLMSGIYLFFAPQTAHSVSEVPSSFNSYHEMMEYHTRLEMPGYGASTGGFGTLTPWGQFTFFSIEVPDKHAFKVFIYARKDETAPYMFVETVTLKDNYPPMINFVVADHQLHYQYQQKGETQSKKSIISD